jgi:hypothetical protein
MGYYDDNFGEWQNMEEEGMVEFYHQVQKDSVLKKCQQCGEQVRIRRSYVICSRCADVNEGVGW